jgi:ubiquinone/menaquinone biosynthesis C-methylase UbiE
MNILDFTKIAASYERDSLVQKSAAEKLISLLDFQRRDDVLDLGCGTGNLTRKLRSLTDGMVKGVDPSTGMILEAKAKRDGLAITFDIQNVEIIAHPRRGPDHLRIRCGGRLSEPGVLCNADR